MELTQWARTRKKLRRNTLLLLLFAAIALFVCDRLRMRLVYLRARVEVLNDMISNEERAEIDAEKKLSDKKNRIEILVSEIECQNKQIAALQKDASFVRNKTFPLFLAKAIQAWYSEKSPATKISRLNVSNLVDFIRASMYYEKVYVKKHPEFEGKYSWKIAMKMLYIESDYVLDPPRGKATELGCPQIREFIYDSNKKRVPQLYNLLCSIGRKKGTYEATIQSYRASPWVQVQAMYEYYTFKLRDSKGNVVKAIVAYNAASNLPEKTVYWGRYQFAGRRLEEWISAARKEAP